MGERTEHDGKMLVDLQTTRQNALARVLVSIGEMEEVLAEMTLENPHRYLVVGVLGRLRSQAAKLAAGLTTAATR
jgi:X-X-X-Leu-X-X-Gly heptad repeat protein